ncbi:MAG: helix-turn-helix domain-containing protein [Gammaproteobacteria bacterium]
MVQYAPPPRARARRTRRAANLAPEHDDERIRRALRYSGRATNRAAKLVGMSRATCWRKRKRLGI